MYEERVIDFSEIIKKILLKWRVILVLMLVGAVSFNALAILKSYKKVQAEIEAATAAALAEEEEENQDNLAKIKELLNEREISDVKTAVEAYKTYRREYRELLEYNQNSIKMKVNSNNVPEMVIQYYIDNHYQTVYPVIEQKDNTQDIIASFCNALFKDDIYSRIISELNWDVKISYIEELISAEIIGTSTLSISVIAENEEFCEAITKIIEEEIKLITPYIQQVYGDFEIKETVRSYKEQANAEIYEEQKARATASNSLKTYMSNLTSGFSENQKTYFNELLNSIVAKKNADEEQIIEVEEIIEETEKTTPIKIQYIHIKYIICGGILGIFVVCCWVIAWYVFSPKIQMADDMVSLYGIPVLGELKESKKRRFLCGVDYFILSLFGVKDSNISKEKRVRVVCEEIRLMSDKENLKSIYMTGTLEDDEIQKYTSLFTESLKTEVQILSSDSCLLNDDKALRSMANSDGIILIEKLGKSRYKDIGRLIEKSKFHKVPVIGSVVLAESI